MNDIDTSPNIQSLPASDIKVDSNNKKETVKKTFEIKDTKQFNEDFLIRVQASLLNNIRNKVSKLKRKEPIWIEILLGISTTFLGIFLSGIIAGDTDVSIKEGWKTYILCPVISATFGISYMFLKYNYRNHPKVDIDELLEEIPDPNNKEDIK